MKKVLCILFVLLLLTACTEQPDPQQTTLSPETNLDPTAPRNAQVGATQIVYQPWTGEGIPTSGDYFLTEDVVLTAAVTVSGKLNLHLNGYTVTASEDAMPGNLFVIPAGSAMTVYDEEGAAGTILSPRSFTAQVRITSMFLVAGELTVAGGTVDASPISLEDKADGLCAYIQAGGLMHMEGGTLIGGTTWRNQIPEDGSAPFGNGGAIYVAVDGTCNISGGQVRSGSAARGGNIYVAGDDSGSGKLMISGGTVTDGEATVEGGNLCINGGFEMTGGTVSLGKCYGHGGNIYLTGNLRMTGGVVSEGKSDLNAQSYRRGGNICVDGIDATVYMENVKLLDGDASGKENHGGNLAVIGYGAKEVEIVGCEITGGKGHRGGNIYFGHFNDDIPEENMDFVITDTLVSDGITSYRGANICVDNKTKPYYLKLTLNNCRLVLQEGDSANNLAVGAGGTDTTMCDVVMNGGAMENGVLVIYGHGFLTLNGVTWANNGYGGSGTLTINE